MTQRVLVIDSDDEERQWLVEELREAGMTVVEASTSEGAAFEALDESIAAIVLAEEMARLRGRRLLDLIRRISSAPIIVVGSGDEPAETTALEGGADIYHRRPIRPRLLIAYIRALLRRYEPPSGMPLPSSYPALAA